MVFYKVIIMKTFEYYKYINTLLKNQNITDNEILQDLATRRDYADLLKPVITLARQNPHADFFALKKLLFEQSKIAEEIKNLVNNLEITPGLIIDFGTEKTRDTLIYGQKQEYCLLNNIKVFNPQEMENNTIFDLASTSKIFTTLAILKLVEENRIDLFDPVQKYIPECTNLKDTTILELLKFKVYIETAIRIDKAQSPEEAEAILFTAKRDDEKNVYNAYTDIGAMLLRVVVERITNMDFNTYLEETILKPLKMEDTYLNVPCEKLSRVANENFSTIIDMNGNPLIRYDNIPGTPHDTKAIAIGHAKGIAPGHAGYFSSTKDMTKLGNALVNGTILNSELITTISENIVGEKLDDETCSWFYGSLVYAKQTDAHKLHVDSRLSGKAFLSPGFAGTTFYVDPLNKLYLFLGANRLHNRIYNVNKSQVNRIIIHPETGKKTFLLSDGTEQVISEDFTKEKEKVIVKALELSFQFQLLEKIKLPTKEKHLVRELN